MPRAHFLPLICLLPALALAQTNTPLAYPPTEKVEHTETIHGQTISDPYAWLEEADTPDSKVWPKVEAWIAAQNKLTFGYLEKIPQRDAIKARMTELWNFERFSPPEREGGRYFFSRNTGLQKQGVLYMMAGLTDEPTVLIDPNALKEDGTIAMNGAAASKDGKYYAYALSDAGSDWKTWRIRDLKTGKDLDETLTWAKFSNASWTGDCSAFVYNRYPEPPKGESLKASDEPAIVCLHKIGTPQSADQVLFTMADKEWSYGAGVTDDGEFMVLGLEKTGNVNNNVSYVDLRAAALAAKPKVVELFKDLTADWRFIDHDGNQFWFLTDDGGTSPRRRVVAVDITKPEKANWSELIPQSADAIQSVTCVDDKFLVNYLHDAKSLVRVHDLKGKLLREVDLPGIGTAGGFSGKRTDKETFYSFTSYNTPGTIYRYDTTTGKSSIFRKPSVKFNPDDYQTTQVFYSSKDGTRVPMFITAKKGFKPTGDAPTLLYAYGGFDISITPAFSPAVMTWLEMGGVYAVPNIRGGGEYGRDWHLAGTKTHKQNVFDDFIAAAEHLIQSNYTNPKKLAIQGGSNGGLLVGACMTQRPELYAACLPQVGVMDMLKFHTWTVGRFWTADYGEIANEDEFKALRAYSPYHNIKAGTCYPPTLITTGDHDDRVYPAHSFKFAAAIQAAQACANPTLIRIETRAGHGAGKPTGKRIEEAADMWAFLVKNLGVNTPTPAPAKN